MTLPATTAPVYFDQSDMIALIGLQNMLAVCDDENNGSIDPVKFNKLGSLACGKVDSILALNYKGPFPVTQVPVPALVVELATAWMKAFLYEASDTYVRQYGSGSARRGRGARHEPRRGEGRPHRLDPISEAGERRGQHVQRGGPDDAAPAQRRMVTVARTLLLVAALGLFAVACTTEESPDASAPAAPRAPLHGAANATFQVNSDFAQVEVGMDLAPAPLVFDAAVPLADGGSVAFDGGPYWALE